LVLVKSLLKLLKPNKLVSVSSEVCSDVADECLSAQQVAERSKYIVMKAEQEKKAAIIRAEAEAKAAELLQKAMATGECCSCVDLYE
jgi:regulator of protease activity HflC (stomatin/prohibitin superfamily)